ncbi:MAG: hypothetical protein ABII75_04455 [Candidatus Omnitrophota bacterium]
MIGLFRDKLKKEGHSLVWFKRNKLPDFRYDYFIQEINGFKKMSDEVKDAIQIYLNEG